MRPTGGSPGAWCAAYRDRISASVINADIPLLYGEAGFILDVEADAIFCSYAADGGTLEATIGEVKPDLILGVSGRKGTISEAAIRSMCRHVETPMIFPLSNPTSSAELTAAEAYAWSDGRAIVATGSPFGPVTLDSGKTLIPSQCNNMVKKLNLLVSPRMIC